jgi:2-polyprenyl-3-methyl-5-hydroxy-6-metoxy-1,4-benzoquinol methylase
MQKQVNKDHYDFSEYVKKQRWASMWHQLDEVNKLKPNKILEIGPGPGLFKATASALGMNVETLDIDPDLKPDHVGSVFELPFENDSFDVVCAFQMLEHLPFDDSMVALSEMTRVAANNVVISLPNAATRWPISFTLPKLGQIRFFIPKIQLLRSAHKFNGQHYWEINKSGYSEKMVLNKIMRAVNLEVINSFRVHEYPYHQFFIFKKSKKNLI